MMSELNEASWMYRRTFSMISLYRSMVWLLFMSCIGQALIHTTHVKVSSSNSFACRIESIQVNSTVSDVQSHTLKKLVSTQ